MLPRKTFPTQVNLTASGCNYTVFCSLQPAKRVWSCRGSELLARTLSLGVRCPFGKPVALPPSNPEAPCRRLFGACRSSFIFLSPSHTFCSAPSCFCSLGKRGEKVFQDANCPFTGAMEKDRSGSGAYGNRGEQPKTSHRTFKVLACFIYVSALVKSPSALLFG